ncbi:hypothetical protein E9993_14720 [Labilibacter sediminis]|nr:hypothetical protein E9993_14720 [Labilibacter sediminis]
MSRAALEDQNYELIKSAVLDPDNTPLPDYLQPVLERTISAAKLLDKNPTQKHAVAILQAKYPKLSRGQAYEDCKRAMRLFNSIHTFDFDYWQHWLLQDISEMIQKAKDQNNLKAWAMGHKNLMQAMGERPETQIDPKLIEKHQNVFAIQVNNQTINIDQKTLEKLPAEAKQALTALMNQPIDDARAEEIFNS